MERYSNRVPQEIFKYTDELTAIGLDLPFSMKINQRLGFDSSFVTYEGLVKSYDYTDE